MIRQPPISTQARTLFTFSFFFNATATTEIYTRPYTLSLHDALPISPTCTRRRRPTSPSWARTSARSEEHTSELQSHGLISYAVFCLKKKKEETKYLLGVLVVERRTVEDNTGNM